MYNSFYLLTHIHDNVVSHYPFTVRDDDDMPSEDELAEVFKIDYQPYRGDTLTVSLDCPFSEFPRVAGNRLIGGEVITINNVIMDTPQLTLN